MFEARIDRFENMVIVACPAQPHGGVDTITTLVNPLEYAVPEIRSLAGIPRGNGGCMIRLHIACSSPITPRVACPVEECLGDMLLVNIYTLSFYIQMSSQ
jgi:hypothetical protein